MEASDTPYTLTAEAFQKLPDEPGYRLELVRGRVVRSPGPGPRHGKVETNLVLMLGEFVRRNGLGMLLSGGTGFVLERGPDTVRGPDISFLRHERVPGDRLADAYLDGAPELAIEILSPSNRPGEMRQRIADFFRTGCQEVWVLSPRLATVTVHRRDGAHERLEADDELTSPLLPGFRCPVREFFRAD